MGIHFRKQLTIILIGLLGLASDATADIVKWKDVGWWDVSFYPGLKGCAASVTYEDGAFFLLGLGGTETLYVDIYVTHRDWRSIEQGKDYDVKVVFGNEPPWNLEMKGVEMESTNGLTFRAPAQSKAAGNFIDEFMRKTRMSWTYEGNSLGVFRLNGSSKAFQEIVACTKSYRDAINSTGDPFSNSSNSRDPFQ